MRKFLCIIFCSNLAYSQTQIYFPKVSNKEHQRALITLPNRQMLSGSSEAVIRLHDPNGKVLSQEKLGAELKEIRDIAVTQKGFIALQSHDSSGIVLLDKMLKVDTLIYPLNKRSALFLDGICAQENLVFLLGDPIDGFFSTFYSTDYGQHWQATASKASANEGEAAYAASGQTNQIRNGHFYFVSGGLTSRLFHSPDQGATWNTSAIPYPSCPTCGPYALHVKNEQQIMTVGGDYTKPNLAQNTCFYSIDGGITWKAPKKAPTGYRSCVIMARNNYYACGTNGIDVSTNNGRTWKKLFEVNALSMTFNGIYIYASLADGSLLRFKP
jgi:photosystem II stability/assembly factor-like uncharacterized protein